MSHTVATHEQPRQIPSRVVPWFDRWFMLKTKEELTLVVLTIVGGYIVCGSTSGWARLMYPHETLFASCHLIFVPDVRLSRIFKISVRANTFGVQIGRCVRRIVDNRMDTRGPLRLFLRRHTLRFLQWTHPHFFLLLGSIQACFLQCFIIRLWFVD
ncbi:hypothetical protein EDD15DRAFT_1120913 [Pisolithus albus]|nr:hypothetical protein EDD15DRAFT_1120913 [Pisolithus albus]